MPRWWRRFKYLMTYQDILMGRKVTYTQTIDGRQTMRVEVVR
jgi:hypothetical protein